MTEVRTPTSTQGLPPLTFRERIVPFRAMAFLRRDWASARSYRLAFVLDMARSAFMLILFFQVGRLVDRGPATEDIQGDYFSFVVIGVAVLQIVQSALGSFAIKLRDEQTTGTLEALLATPTAPWRVILGSALYDLVRALVMALLLVVLGTAMGLQLSVTPPSVVVALVALLGLLGVAASLGVLVAAFTVVFKRGMALAWAITSGLSLVGGVFYPVDLLPAPIAWAARWLPFTRGVHALREALLEGRTPLADVALVVVTALALVLVSVTIFRAAVDRARTLGTLGQY
jgi:ABC-2 type transport system permease protein